MFRVLFIMFTFVFYLSVKVYMSFFSNYKSYIVIPILMLFISLPFVWNIAERFEIIRAPSWTVNFSYIVFAVYIIFLLTNLFFDIMWVLRLRVDFIHGSAERLGIATLVFSVVFVLAGYIHHNKTRVVEYDVVTPKKLEQDLRIVALGDIHIGSNMTIDWLRSGIETINSLNPDIVVLVGDIIDNNIKHFTQEYQDEFKKIKSKYGVYSVFGNHEYYSGAPAQVMSAFNGSGFTTLRDEVVFLEELGIYIIGRNTATHNFIAGGMTEKKHIGEFVRGMDLKKPVIILDHIPDTIEDGKLINADIQLSGHTHKGQFYPATWIVKLMYPNAHGLLKTGDFNLIVTSGFGLWGPPVRLGSNSEILLVNLTSSYVNDNVTE